jgi:hypothetical protein
MLRTWLQIAFLILLVTLRLTGPACAAGAAGPPILVATQELIFGNGTPGPFSLAWTAVRFGTERLSVNGARLQMGLDYLLDYGTGALTFSQALPSGQIAQVDYVYDAASAKPNHGPTPVPLSMRVWGSDEGGLQMIGAVAPGAVPGGPPSGSLLGFRGESGLGGSQVSSLFLLAPDASGHSHPSAWQTAALQFGAAHTRGTFQFHGSVAQAGAGFSQAKEYQLQQGLRVLDLGAAFDPSKRFSFTTQVKRQDALDASEKGNEQSSIANQLTVTPTTSTKLTLSQESTSKARSQGLAETLDALRAQIEQKISGGTIATLVAEQRQTDSTGRTATTGLDLASHLTGHTSLTAGFVQNDNDHQGRDSTSNLALSVRPAGQLGFHLGFNQHLTQTQGDATGADWGVTAGRNGLIKVEGKTSQTVAASGPGEQDEQLRIETSPLRGVKITRLSGTKQVGQDAARESQETSLELSPLRALQVAGAVGEEAATAGTTYIRSVSGTLKPAPFLNLSGAYKTRDVPVGDAIVTRDVHLAVIPFRGLKLQGSYVENPEDKDGQVLNTTDTSLGLDSTIGSLAFGGSYTEGEGGVTSQQREESEFRLALNLWGHSRLYSNFKTSEERAGSITQNRTLSLGFTRSLGNRFSLLLEGEVTEVQVNGVPQPGQSDQRAQAKLAMRF